MTAIAALAVAAFLLLWDLAAPGVFHAFFGWPNGGVWSNLVASALWGLPALTAILRKLARNHAEHIRLLQEHHEKLVRSLPPRGSSLS